MTACKDYSGFQQFSDVGFSLSGKSECRFRVQTVHRVCFHTEQHIRFLSFKSSSWNRYLWPILWKKKKKKNKITYYLILWVIDIPLSWEQNIRQEMHMYVYVLSRIRLFATSRTIAHQAGSFAHRIFQARILEWVAIFYSRQEIFKNFYLILKYNWLTMLC